MKKLLVTGSSGMFGSAMVSEIGNRYEVVGIYKEHSNPALKNQFQIDLRDAQEVRKIVNSVNPDFVIHCAAITNVDVCEGDYALAHDTNTKATGNLISAIKPDVRFIYISTDSVFNGKRGHYSETDTPCPLNNYAKSKLEGERIVEKRLKNYVIIRTCIFGRNTIRKGTSFVEWIYDSLSNKRRINMFTDIIFSPITVNTLSHLIERLLNSDLVGRLNIASTNAISKYDFGVYFAGLFGFDKSLITPVKADSFSFKARRPKNTSLNVSKANSILGPLPTAEDEITLFYRKNTS